MDNFLYGADPELVRRALRAQGSDYVLPPLDPSLRQMPDIGAPPPPPVDDPYAGVLDAAAKYGQAYTPEVPTPAEPAIAVPPGQDPDLVNQALQMTAPTTAEARESFNAGSMASANQAITDMERAARDQSISMEQVANAQAQGYEQEVEARKQAQAENDRLLSLSKARNEDYDRSFKEEMSRLKAINDEAAKLPTPKVRRSNIQRLMGGIAVGMGQAADHFAMVGGAHTDNAQQIQHQINTVIERDIQAQREAIANKRADAQGKMTEMSLARQHFGDTIEGDKFGALMVKERTANELGIVAAQTSNKKVKAEVLGAQAALTSAVAKEKLGLYKTLMSKKISATQAQMLNWTPQQAAAYNASIGAEEEGQGGVELPIGSKEGKAAEEIRNADRKRLDTASDPNVIRGTPGLAALPKLQAYVDGTTPIPEDAYGEGQVFLKGKNTLMLGQVENRSKELIDLQNASGAALDASLRIATGANAPKDEIEELRSRFGIDWSKIKNKKQVIDALQRQVEAIKDYEKRWRAADPEAWDEAAARIRGEAPKPLTPTDIVEDRSDRTTLKHKTGNTGKLPKGWTR